jgi:hypothetical protein
MIARIPMNKALSIVLIIVATDPAYAGWIKPHTVLVRELMGLPVLTIQTSEGARRFLLDTGSNISTMDIQEEKDVTLRVAGKKFTLRFRPTRTEVFRKFEALLPADEHVDGILGSDFLHHFRRVSFDFEESLVSFE